MVVAPYASAHASPNGPTDTRPTALQIIKDNDLFGALKDKVMLVTGTSSGIGIETAKALAATGAKVYCTVRDLKKGEAALKDTLEPGCVELLQMDQNSLASVRQCAEEFLGKSKTLNVLVCNAGIMMNPEGRTADGFELQFGTNHLSHFLLFNLLKPALLAGSSPTFQSRVVNVSSSGHRGSKIHFDNLTLSGEYMPHIGYGQSKTANILMANEIENRYGAKGIHGFSLHPGGIWTGLQIHMDQEAVKGYKKDETVNKLMKSVEQGAATTVWAAVAKVWEGKGRVFLEDCQESVPVEGEGPMVRGYESWAFDKEAEGRLWVESLKLVGLPQED
ncbi:hypothetical protein MMC25_004146 [Agyrium rufum]|nr:hypothetical protein [Agyrium rufum]